MMGGAVAAILKPIGAILGGGEKAKTIVQKAPEPEPEPVMPVADDATLGGAQRRQAAAARQRSGRLSTILVGDSAPPHGGYG